MKLRVTEYLTFSLMILLLGISLFMLMSLLFSGINFSRTNELKNINYGFGYAQKIMLNNMLNFAQYFIFFFDFSIFNNY
jgi:hypothetical protein